MELPTIYGIVATTTEGGISFENKTPWPKNLIDLKYFQYYTTQTLDPDKINIVLMGYTTWKNDLKCKKLKKRMNVVLTKKVKLEEDVKICNNIEEFFKFAGSINDKIEKIFVIGGASIYKQMFKYCKEIIHTTFKTEYKADLFIELEKLEKITNDNIYEDDKILINKKRFILNE